MKDYEKIGEQTIKNLNLLVSMRRVGCIKY